MIPCICINDDNKPRAIPKSKWLVKDKEYHVIYTVTVLPQKQLAFHLAEIELDESCKPYEYFLASRFAFTQENLLLLMELIKDCSEITFSMDELLEQTAIEI
jgi:hypothetical protein